MWALSLLLLPPMACVPAAHQAGASWQGAFQIDAPPRWTVTRNRRLLGHHVFTLSSPDDCCTIDVERLREGRAARELPLSLIADVLPSDQGRIHGHLSEPVARHQLDLAGREAWATALERTSGPQAWFVTTVYTRADGFLYVLTLTWPPDAGTHAARAWERVLSSFDIPSAPPPNGPLYVRDQDTGSLRFHRAPVPTTQEVQIIVDEIARRVRRFLARRGFGEDQEDLDLDPDDL